MTHIDKSRASVDSTLGEESEAKEEMFGGGSSAYMRGPATIRHGAWAKLYFRADVPRGQATGLDASAEIRQSDLVCGGSKAHHS